MDSNASISIRLPKVHNRSRRRARPRSYEGTRLAVLRAFTASSWYLCGRAPTIAAAARCCGAGIRYTIAAKVVQSQDSGLRADVLSGRISLLEAVTRVRQINRLVSAYQKSTGEDLAQFGRLIGPAKVFDEIIIPAL